MPVDKGTGSRVQRAKPRKPRTKVDFTPIPVVPKGKTPDSVTQWKRGAGVRTERTAREAAAVRQALREPPKTRLQKYGFETAAGITKLDRRIAADRARQGGRRAAAEDERRRSRQRASVAMNALQGALRAVPGGQVAAGLAGSGLGRGIAEREINLGLAGADIGKEILSRGIEAARTPTYGGVRGRYSPAAIQVGSVPLAVQATSYAAPALGKVLAGGAGGVAGGVRHPGRVVEEAVKILSGTTQTAGLIVAMSNPSVTGAQRRKLADEVVTATLADLEERYGPNTTWAEAVEKGYNEPLISTLNALAVVAPAAKGVSIGKYLRAGASLREARRLSRNPDLEQEILGRQITKPRKLTVQAKYVDPYQVEIGRSGQPLTRALGRGYDIAGRGAERVGVGRVPVARAFTPTRRALREQRKNLRRQKDRLRANGVSLWRDVQALTKSEPEQAPRLFYAMQKPDDLPEETWLRALAGDMEEMLGGRDVVRKGSPSAAEQKLRKRVERFRAQADAASQARWSRRVETIADEQAALERSLETLEERESEITTAMKEARASGDTDAVAGYRADLRTVRATRKTVEEELAPLQIEPAPIESSARSAIEQQVRALPNVSGEQADALMAVLDTRARAWAAGRDTRKRSRAEAAEFIAAADAKYERLLATEIEGIGPIAKGAVSARNRIRNARRRGSLDSDMRIRDAKRALDRKIEAATHPAAVAFREEMDEADRLRTELGTSDAAVFGERGEADLGDIEGRDPGEWFSDPEGFDTNDVRTLAEETGVPAGALVRETTEPEIALSETRKADLNGAGDYLQTPRGGRILDLVESDNASTALARIVTHGVFEMKTAYPREFAHVEEIIGRPLADWAPEDHARFGRMFERYAADGAAPTPELVPTFRHLKRWSRSIYGSIRNLGRPISPEVRALFDTYFGAYNDENVFRVAAMQTRIPEDMRVARAGTLFDFSSEELATLRKRNETRAYNKSLEGLAAKIRKLAEKDVLDDDEADLLSALEAQYLDLAAQQAVAAVDRQGSLRRRLNEVEKAMGKPTGRRYDGALASLEALSDQRETILRSVFGDKYDAVFAARSDLLADFLVDQDLLSPDFATGTARYVPHMPEGGGKPPRKIDQPGRPLVSAVVGKTDTSLLNLHRRNNLIRWQNGDLHADPVVVYEAWLNAQSFAFIHGLKEHLWDIGKPLRVDEGVPDDVYVINRNGIPIPSLQRRTLPPASSDEIQGALDALDGRDLVAMEATLATYAEDILMTPERLRQKLDEGVDPFALDLRIVDKAVVDAMFRPLQGGASTGSQVLDLGLTLSRTALIYTNPAYVPTNFIGNNFFLFAQQGPQVISNLVRAARILFTNPKLAERIAGEVGELPLAATAVHSRAGRGGVGRVVGAVKAVESTLVTVQSRYADKWPRMAAWVYEARRMGYRTNDDLYRLLDGKGPNGERVRNTVSDRSTEVMVNFDRLSDFERNYVTKVLFIWPWIRGATAWPFYYAREYPVQTAAAANVALPLEERREEMMGPVPLYRRGLFPVERRGGKVQVINVNPISPTSTAMESVQALYGNLQSVLHGEELQRGEKLLDYLNPMLEMAYTVISGEGTFGQPMSMRDALLEGGLSFVPQAAFAEQLLDPSKQSKVYDERTRKDIIERKLLRFTPEQVDLPRLNAFQESTGKKTSSEKIAEETQSLREGVRKLGGDPVIPRSVTYSLGLQVVWDDAQDRLKEQLKAQRNYQPSTRTKREPTLQPAQRAALAYAMVERYAPAAAENILRPDQIEPEMLETYAEALIYGSKEYQVEGLLQPLTDFKAEMTKERRRQREAS